MYPIISPSPIFSPLLYTPVLWGDANDPAGNGTQPANNSALATWVDKSGYINNATQATGSKQALFKTNMQAALPAIRFDGVDDWYPTPNVINTSDFTIFEVKRILNYTDKRGIYWFNGSGQLFYSNNQTNGQGVYAFSPTTILNNTAQSSDFFIQTHIKSSTTATLYKNGIQQDSNTVNAAAINSYLTIGADYTGGACGNTDYCEILVYSYALTLAQIANITNYLKNKWGIA